MHTLISRLCAARLDSPAATIPADDVKASRVYQGGAMGAANDKVLKGILEVDKPPVLTDYYTSCMASLATTSANTSSAGASTSSGGSADSLLLPYTDAIAATETAADLAATVGMLHKVPAAPT